MPLKPYKQNIVLQVQREVHTLKYDASTSKLENSCSRQNHAQHHSKTKIENSTSANIVTSLEIENSTSVNIARPIRIIARHGACKVISRVHTLNTIPALRKLNGTAEHDLKKQTQKSTSANIGDPSRMLGLR